MLPQYYLTLPDPDYLPKGSRDPLGFQVVWQHQGKKIIPYLSTVSSLMRDFQTLCMARYLYRDETEKGWPKFFMRFEQLMAYVRISRFPDKGFNGVDRARRRMNESNRYPISNNPNDEILSSQRAYGIWGKYNRPFQDIRFHKDEQFEAVFHDKLNTLMNNPVANRIISKLIQGDRFFVDREALLSLFPLFDLPNIEKEFYLRKILRIPQADAYQNRLLAYVKDLPETTFNLYGFLQSFSDYLKKDETNLKHILQEHAQTERVLSPCSAVFRYLQTKPLWTRAEINNDDYITQCNQPHQYPFNHAEPNGLLLTELSEALGNNNWNLTQVLTKRNSEVTNWRGGASWLDINKDLLEVRHADGAMKIADYDPAKHHENEYFIPTFISLYQQLQR